MTISWTDLPTIIIGFVLGRFLVDFIDWYIKKERKYKKIMEKENDN